MGQNSDNHVAWDAIDLNGIGLVVLTDKMPEGFNLGHDFETMVFGVTKSGSTDFTKAYDEYTRRYDTKEEALKGHAEVVLKLSGFKPYDGGV